MQDSDGLHYLTWDQNGMNLLLEKDDEGFETAEYTHGYTPIDGIGSLVEAKKTVWDESHTMGVTYYQYPGYSTGGRVHAITDENGNEIGGYEYNGFGEKLQSVNPPSGNRFQFQLYRIERFRWEAVSIADKGV